VPVVPGAGGGLRSTVGALVPCVQVGKGTSDRVTKARGHEGVGYVSRGPTRGCVAPCDPSGVKSCRDNHREEEKEKAKGKGDSGGSSERFRGAACECVNARGYDERIRPAAHVIRSAFRRVPPSTKRYVVSGSFAPSSLGWMMDE